MKTGIEKIGGHWVVTFEYGVQKFTLANSGTKKEVQWIKKQLDKCFQKYELAIMEKHCGVAGEIINKIFNENEAS